VAGRHRVDVEMVVNPLQALWPSERADLHRWCRRDIVAAVSLPAVVFTFGSGARALVRPNDAAWLRDELLRCCTFGTPRHSLGVIVDERLRRLERGEDALSIPLEGGGRAAVARALEAMLAADSARLRGTLGLMHLRDLLATER
jgi:hypothetical protein